MNQGVMRLKLNSICPGTSDFMVVGIIIAKQSPRVIVSKIDQKEKSVFSFTIRDSPEDIVNVNVWGSKDYINHLYNDYKIGDVVDIINSNVKFKPEIEEKYMPKSSSAFILTLNESVSQLLFHDKSDSIKYNYLLKIPTCLYNMFLKIEDIHSSGKEMNGKFCSLLVAIRCVKPTKLIKTKIGKETFLKEIIVMDKTHPTLVVRIWDEDTTERAKHWLPKKTILAFSDLYIEWKDFKNNMTAVVSSRTIITEDPISNEANDLKNYADRYLVGLSNKLNINIPNLSSITDIMTCKRVLLMSHERNRPQFTAVVFAIVSKFNIDGLYPMVYNKCNLCGMNVESIHLMCLNLDCPSNLKTEIESDELESILDIRLSLTDSTGTLENCTMHHVTATKVLSEVNNFQSMSLSQRTELKWKYLFTNCAMKLVISKTYPEEKPTILVVDIDNKGPIFQFITSIPIY